MASFAGVGKRLNLESFGLSCRLVADKFLCQHSKVHFESKI